MKLKINDTIKIHGPMTLADLKSDAEGYQVIGIIENNGNPIYEFSQLGNTHPVIRHFASHVDNLIKDESETPYSTRIEIIS